MPEKMWNNNNNNNNSRSSTPAAAAAALTSTSTLTRLSCLLRTSTIILITSGSSSDAFSPPIGRCGLATLRPIHQQPAADTNYLKFETSPSSRRLVTLSNKSNGNDDDDDDAKKTITTTTTTKSTTTSTTKKKVLSAEGLNRVFDAVDTDKSGAIDLDEYDTHLSSAGYSSDAIRKSFDEIDTDGDGTISRDELRTAIRLSNFEDDDFDENCPMGYWLDSVDRACKPLGPVGRMSQRLENAGPLKKVYGKISNVFGVDRAALRKKGIPFLLTYSIISNLNGAVSLSVAWYMTVKRTGLSPLVPGQKKSLLASYAMIYGALQVLKPFRVAAAVAMSKLSADYLEMTQERFRCSRNVAIGCQYLMGQVMMGITFYVGVTVVSLITGVPIWG
mmetsp:Transcript_30023/g.62765  ORF Transcript_30023/g.62765 Transcript_30023/m.62765 type:complete len:389 (-) Transcript_30023:407-1573(-)